MFSPICQSTCLTVPGDLAIRSRIVSLFRASGPFAVFGTIVSVIINSVNRVVFAGLLSHIGVEIFKSEPAIAHRDSATAVMPKRPLVGVSTSGQHCSPNPVGRTTTHTMSRFAFGGAVALQTATALRVVIKQFSALHDLDAAADAPTQPPTLFVRVLTGKAHDGQPAKRLPFEILKSVSCWFGLKSSGKIFISHVRLLLGECWLGLRKPFTAVSQAASIVSPVDGARTIQI